jgi:hypothetical protein
MLNEFVCCPRLGYLMWAEAEFDVSADTVDGKRVHRRTDAEKGDLPDAGEEAEKIHACSVWLSAPGEGLTARMDLVEEFRPLVVDSAVLQAINTGVVKPDDFVRRGGAVAMENKARARFIEAYERRMDQLVSHPLFGYRVSYRRILEVRARLLARHLNGELEEYPEFCTR